MLNYFILALAFFLPISKAVFSILVGFVLLFWLFERNLKEKALKILSNKFIVVLLIFILFNFISIFWASDKLFAFHYMKKYMYLLLIPIIYTSFDTKNIEKFFNCFLSGMFISVIVAHLTYFGIIAHKIFIASPFMDHSTYGIYLSFSLVLLYYKFKNTFSLKVKFLLFLFSLLVLSNLLINTGRTGPISLFLTLLLFVLFKSKNKIKFFILIIVSSSILGLLAFNFNETFKDRYLYLIKDVNLMVSEKNFSSSFSTRVSLWMIASNQFYNNPFIGTGIGDEMNHSEEFIQNNKIENAVSIHIKNGGYIDFHSAFFQYAAQLGIIGFLLYSYMFIYLFTLKIKNHFMSNLSFYFTSLMFFYSCIGVTFRYRFSIMFFILFSSIFLLMSELKKKNEIKVDKNQP